MGMGDIVDTVPPYIVITSPYDGQWMNEVNRGDPIKLNGTWEDADTEVKLMTISEVHSGKVFTPDDGLVELIIDPQGTWKASLLLTESGDYRIKVSGFDRFKNEGTDTVNIRVDLVDPLVNNAAIKRYLDSGAVPESELHDREYYEGLNYWASKAYQNIKWANIDEFQNEAFTLKLQFADSFSGVKASRLYVLDEYGDRISPELKPDRGGNSQTPEWDITSGMLQEWKPDYSENAHFISFEVWAWNGANWNEEHDQAIDGATHREQKIKGTCWYPESDAPHIAAEVTDDTLESGQIILDTAIKGALGLTLYDDDKLSEIYAGFMSKENFDALRGSESEVNYLESLASNSVRRDAVIACFPTNLYDLSAASTDGRQQTVRLDTGGTGEYRLIAIVKDGKNATSAHYGQPATNIWGVYPPLRVHVRNPDSPIIIVESPAVENVFPTLNGTKFNMSGYTIDRQGVQWIQIAWVPSAVPNNDAFTFATDALNSVAATLNPGNSATATNGVKVWKIAVGTGFGETLNGVQYMRNNFTTQFDILGDFGDEANSNKFFVIHARNIGSGDEYKTFRMSNYTEMPKLELIYPYMDMMVHDTNVDLILHIKASANNGIGIKQDTIKISDVTIGNTNENLGFFEPDPLAPTDEKKRMVTSDYIISSFGDGAKRTYRFEAEDILGNKAMTERTIIMSNLPALLYITSSTGPGLYKEGVVLTFEAVFSMAVKVNKGAGAGPRLKLYWAHPGDIIPTLQSPDAYADYVDVGFTSNTLIFSYTVKAGDSTDRLHTSLDPIDRNGALLETAQNIEGGGDKDAKITFDNHNNSLQNAFKDNSGNSLPMQLDGVRPSILYASFAQTGQGGISYFNKGKQVTLRLETSEQVQVTGTPTAYIGYGSATAAATFSSVKDNGRTLEFTWLVDADNVPETKLRWTVPWIGTNEITDMAGNMLDLSGAASLPSNRLDGGFRNMEAYIITRAPVAPTFTLHAAGTGSPPVLTGTVLSNATRYVRVAGIANHTLYYSGKGGNNPTQITATAFGQLLDSDVGNRDKDTYVPSEYAVTAWQVDRAGNRSPNAPERSVTINSRAPELEGISCLQPDGSYPASSSLTFKLSFSRPVLANANHTAGAPIRLTLKGTGGFDYTDYVSEMPVTMTNGANQPEYSTIFTFDCTVPPGLKMKNIKAVKIELSGVQDEYGNISKTFDAVSSENATTRPIADGINLNNRDNLIILSTGPYITTYSPAAPTETGSGSNGGVMTSGSKNITFTFDRKVTAQAGGLITVRPWGTWALPPILTTAEIDSLLNSPNYGGQQLEYQHRLKWTRTDGLPAATPSNDIPIPYEQRDMYNFYVNNTNGLVEKSGKVRPDTSGKWVLAYQHDLYGGANEQRLRDVFNAAKWKWQEIASTSGSVAVSGSTVTITINDLQPGRIWEVLMTEGAFRDDAGNSCAAIVDSEAAGVKYRFWSAGTAQPVIRVDKYSHGDHYHGQYFRGDQITRPAIDTKVRIDCETPGAGITYGVIRTKYTMPAGGTTFTDGSGTDAAFFNHDYVPYIYNTITINSGGGSTNNTIGNGGNLSPPPKDGDGYFIGLLVPNAIEPGGGTFTGDVTSHNGAIDWSSLTVKAADLTYCSVAANGAVTYDTPTLQPFFYAGDAYNTTSDLATGDTDSRLYTGRRDYVVAVATKAAVNAGVSAGPGLSGSGRAYEGVFKTTLLYRNFGIESNCLLIQGFDEPVVPATPGFPLRLTYTDTAPIPTDYHSTWAEHMFTYYTKQAYRQGGTLPSMGGIGRVQTGDDSGRSDRNNNYIWVSWDIVTDWYQMAKGALNSFNFLQRNNYNYNGVLATYGAVTYRYEQNYTGGTGSGGTQ
jgi:hypothetical protein